MVLKKNLLWILLVTWLVINLAQAYFTGLFSDEAYYFFYSRDLAWGYYDHPPLTAIFIRLGYYIFNNELGVRILFVLLSLGTILIIHKLAGVKNDFLFGVMTFSFMIFQITGFLAFPDSVLLFFTAAFFLVYKNYTEESNLTNSLLLGVVMAGLLYSKYLGVVIIFFTFISNAGLFMKRSFWAAVIVTTMLFLPHLAWQYRHDFPSVYYHLLERSHDEVFRWNNFGGYIIGQFGLTNPLLFIPALYYIIRFKPLNFYDRSLKFSALGSLLLPFLLMLKGKVEANWTMAGLIPVFIIAYRSFECRPKFYRYLYFSGWISLVFILMIRILLISNFLPEKYHKQVKALSSGWEAFSKKVSVLAGNRPVVFIGSYQNPSQYMFYTGKEAFSFNNALYRNNQFDLETIEEGLQGRDVLVFIPKRNLNREEMREYNIQLTDSLRIPTGSYQYYHIEKNYRSYNYIKADILPGDQEIRAGTEVTIPIVLRNPGDHPVNFNEAGPGRVCLAFVLLQYGKPVIADEFEDISHLVLKDEYSTSFRMTAPDKPGIYYLRVSIKSRWLPPGINSRLFKIKVK